MLTSAGPTIRVAPRRPSHDLLVDTRPAEPQNSLFSDRGTLDGLMAAEVSNKCQFQGGAYDPWGGWGFEQCSILVNHEFERVFYKNNMAAGVTIFSVYMVRFSVDGMNVFLTWLRPMAARIGEILDIRVVTHPMTMARFVLETCL